MVFFTVFGHTVILTFDVLIQKPNQFIFVARCTTDSDKFGENPSPHIVNIAKQHHGRKHARTDGRP